MDPIRTQQRFIGPDRSTAYARITNLDQNGRGDELHGTEERRS